MYRFLIIYLRSIRNNPKIFLINITSFSVGIVAVLFITLFVVKEFRADRFHKKHHAIYRLLYNYPDAAVKYPDLPYPLGKLLQDNHPEIQDFTRYRESNRFNITFDNKEFKNQKICWVDRSFFSIFDFKLSSGDLNSLFGQPDAIIINQETAQRYFNNTDILGKTLTTEISGEEKKEYTIVGVLDKYPEESTLQPSLITSIESIAKGYENAYFISSPQLFLYIPKSGDINKLASQYSTTFNRKYVELTGNNVPVDEKRYTLQRLSNLYLKSSDVSDNLPKGDYSLVLVLAGIGVVLLLVTFMNYLILNLGINLKNQKQDQIRVIFGSSSGWLKMKYATESILFVVITFFVALLLYPMIHQFIASFSNYRYKVFSGSDLRIVLAFLFILILLGALAGFLQYAFQRKKRNIQLSEFKNRNYYFHYFIQFQLIVFIIIVSSVILINRQMNFIRNQDLGFDLKNTVSVMLFDVQDMKRFMQECNNNPIVKNISVGHALFANTVYLSDVTIEKNKEVIKSQYFFGDNNYLNTYNIKLLSGKNMDVNKIPPVEDLNSYPRDNEVIDILVNEEFIRKSGLQDPLGTIVSIRHIGTNKGRIVGIIANVKNNPFYNFTTPLIIGYGLGGMPSVIISVQEGKKDEFKSIAKNFISKIGKESQIGYSTYSFDFQMWYHKEQVLMHILSLLSGIILCILLLGIYASSLFLSESKTKEIGIRKVNGAKISEILKMLNKDFIKWVAIAFVIATPVAYYAMNKWLENFAYKTSLSWWIFALAGLLALGIALLTVSFQSWKAATRNPVEALRYE